MFFAAYQIVIEKNNCHWNFKIILIMLSYKSQERLNNKILNNTKGKESFLAINIYLKVPEQFIVLN